MALDGTQARLSSRQGSMLFQVTVGVVVLVGEEDRWTRRQGWLSSTDQTWAMVIIAVCQFVFIDRRLRHPLLLSHAFQSLAHHDSRSQVHGAWIHAIRRDVGKDFKVTSNTRVCSAHFRASDYRVSAYAGTAAAPSCGKGIWCPTPPLSTVAL